MATLAPPLDLVAADGMAASTRVPFRFPFDPPAIALPLTPADYLTRNLTASQKETYIGGGIKLLAGTIALAGVVKALLVRGSNARERQRQASMHHAKVASRDHTFTETEIEKQAAMQSSLHETPSQPLAIVEEKSDDDEEGESTSAPSAVEATPARRSVAPASHIDTLRKKPRASQAPSSRTSPYKTPPAVPQRPLTPPFSIGLVTPRSLERYGQLLASGFGEVIAREAGTPDAILHRVELLVPTSEETHAAFSARVRALNLDVLLVQYHGSAQEDVVAFLDYGYAQRILLLHRPIEILERHAQHVFKQDQFNVHTLLRDVECTVVLGEAARPQLLKLFPPSNPPNICVVPHGFSGLDDALVNRPRKLTPVACVGALTTWSDMRWVTDLLQLNQMLQTASRDAKKKAQVVVYGAGHFVPFMDLKSKTMIDQYEQVTKQFPDKVVVHTKEEFLAAESRGEVTDVASLKAYLWKLSEEGARVVLCKADLFDSPLHTQVFDFTTHLFREALLDYTAKVEYSGALHHAPGASLPIVFESPATLDLEIEGAQMIAVPYGNTNDHAQAAAAASATPADASTATSPWYSSPLHCPDFTPAATAVLNYVTRPQHYLSHRQAAFTAAKDLTMRHVALQYKQLVAALLVPSASLDE